MILNLMKLKLFCYPVLEECLNCQLTQVKERKARSHSCIMNNKLARRLSFYLYHRNFNLILKRKKKGGGREGRSRKKYQYGHNLDFPWNSIPLNTNPQITFTAFTMLPIMFVQYSTLFFFFFYKTTDYSYTLSKPLSQSNHVLKHLANSSICCFPDIFL